MKISNFSIAPGQTMCFVLKIQIILVILFNPATVLSAVPSNVLILSSYHFGYRWSDEIIQGLDESLDRNETEVNLFVEYMDSKRVYSHDLYIKLADLIEEKYSGVPLTAVIIADNNAFSFYSEYRERLFSGIPAIFCGANDLRKSDLEGIDKITGVNEAADVKETLEAALQLFPDTHEIVVVCDQTSTGENVSREIRRQASAFTDRVSIEYWENISMEKLLAQLGKLKKGTIVLYAFFFRDSENHFFEYDRSARLVSEASPVPVFTLWDFNLGYGVVGGKLVSGYEQGRVAGEIALKVVGGQSIDSIPLVMKSPNRFAFDYNVLKRFNVKDAKLPLGSLVINKKTTLYEQYKKTIWGFLLSFALLLVLTLFLLISIARERRIEANLRRSRNFITGITDNAPGVVFQLQIMNRERYELTFAGEKMSHIFGLDHSFPDLFDRFAVNIHDDDRASFRHCLNSAVRLNTPWDFEGRYIKPDGQMIWFTVQAVPRVEEGNTVFDGVLLDITESKNTEYKLQQSEKRLSEIVNFLPDPTIVIDPEGRVLIWNKAMENLTGIPGKDMLGKGNYEYSLVFYGERRPSMIDLVSNWNEEVSELYKDITRIGDQLISETIEPNELLGGLFFRTVASPLYDQYGNVAGAIESVHDITQQRKAELEAEKLFNESQTNLAFIRALMAAIPIPLYFKDTSFRFTDCNQAYLALMGVENIRGKTVHDIYPKEIADIYHQRDAELLRDQNLHRFEAEVIDKNGKHREVLFAKSVFQDHTGKVAGIVGTFMDISDLKESERAKKNLEAQLQQAQKMESVGRLAGGVAHDFNNMLGVILGHAEIGMERIPPEHELSANLLEILMAAKRSAGLTRQLLAFARKQTISPQILDLNETVEGMLKMLRRLIGEDIELAWFPGKNLWSVKVDPSQVDQILANLCVNARDAIFGQGKVTIETEYVCFDDDYCSRNPGVMPGEFVLLAVSDNGCGMDKETQANIFEPFYTTKAIDKGTGLGLATVYGIIKQNNGFIHVYSEPDKGTTFKVYLSRHQTGSYTLRQKAKDQQVELGNETILLVEDEPSILNMTKIMLESLGYQVIPANTPGEAIRFVKESKREIHLLITDVIMPEMNGRELAEKIISMRPGLKRLLMSGYTADVTAHHGVLDEGVNFIEKPFTKKKLGTKVRESLDDPKGG